jgi:hypothetical protein
MALSELQQLIRENNCDLRYVGTVEKPGLIRECLTFIKNTDSGRAEAEDGKHDDTVIAKMIAVQLCKDIPYQPSVKDRELATRSRQAEATESKNAGIRFKSKG